MDLLLNDDVLGAEKAVEGGNSSYHKVFSQTHLFCHFCIYGSRGNNLFLFWCTQLAGGVVAFLRASLGFETEIMKEGVYKL